MKEPNKIKNLKKLSKIVAVPEFISEYGANLENLRYAFGLNGKFDDDGYYSVRSAELDEDSSKSNAGKYTTYLNQSSYESFCKIKEFNYGCIIQRMLKADYSGVANYNSHTEILQLALVQGLCSTITSGQASGDYYEMINGKIKKEFLNTTKHRIHLGKEAVGDPSFKTSIDKLDKIYEYDLEKISYYIDIIVKHFEFSGNTNIEFSMKDGIFYGLQCREINI